MTPAGPAVDLSCYLVTDSAQLTAAGHDPVSAVTQAVAGGVTAVQVRDKQADARDVLAFVEALSGRLPQRTALFVNDRIDVFLAARARGSRVTGVHIGQRDLPPEAVRALVGPDAVIGLSVSDRAGLLAAQHSTARVGYVGIGAVHATGSKVDAPAPIGVAAAGELARTSRLPAVAIGGIRPKDVGPLRQGGLAGVAVVSWICQASDPFAAAAQLSQRWTESA